MERERERERERETWGLAHVCAHQFRSCLSLFCVNSLPAPFSFLDNTNRRSTPESFLFRELGIRRLGDHFDFSTAAVDLIPTAPADLDAKT